MGSLLTSWLWARGLRWGQEWGEVNPQPPWSLPQPWVWRVAAPTPDPRSRGPSEPDDGQGAAPALGAQASDHPTSRPHPAGSQEALSSGTQRPEVGRWRAGGVSEGCGGEPPRYAGGGHGAAHAGCVQSSRHRVPSPPAEWPGAHPRSVASEHLPIPGEKPPVPSSAPQNSRGLATVPRSQAGQRPSRLSGFFSAARRGRVHRGSHTPHDPSDRDRSAASPIWGRKLNGGGRTMDGIGDCLALLAWVLPPVTGLGFQFGMRAHQKLRGVKKKKKEKERRSSPGGRKEG